MNTPTYYEQWQKITTAYLNNELDPYSECACFIGNMLNGDRWGKCRDGNLVSGQGKILNHAKFVEYTSIYEYRDAISWIYNRSNGLYTAHDIIALENNFLSTIYNICDHLDNGPDIQSHPNYENALFEAMVSTLELLKQIHIAKGEIIDESPVFNKRELQPA